MANKVHVESGGLWKVVGSKRVGFNSLADAIFELSKCGLTFYDQVTESCVRITVQNGVLVVDADPSTVESFCVVSYVLPNPAYRSVGVYDSDGGGIEDNDTVTINGRVYTFKDSPVAADEVDVGGTDTISVGNLVNAINLTGIAGTTYGAATTINAHVTAVDGVDGTMTVTSKLFGNNTDYGVSTSVGAWGAGNLTNLGTESILVASTPVVGGPYEIRSPGVNGGSLLSTLSANVEALLIANGVAPIGVTTSIVGLTFKIDVTIDHVQINALEPITIVVDVLGGPSITTDCPGFSYN
jgi:hypothetical protein